MVDIIETHEDEAPENQEHIKEMIDKAERVQSVPRDDGKPTWLPDKFENPEDMAEAYAQLEQKLSSRDTQQEIETEEKTSPTPVASEEQISEALSKQGLDFEKYAREYAENGSLSGDSYQELAQGGMTEEVVNTWITGQQALADNIITQAHDAIGGQKEYESLMEWATKSLEEKEIDVIDKKTKTKIGMIENIYNL